MSDYRYKVRGAAGNSSLVEITPKPGNSNVSPRPGHLRRDFPVAVSPSQAYYWKRSWQEAEREALAEIAAGKAQTFSGAEAAIRYLLGPDDE